MNLYAIKNNIYVTNVSIEEFYCLSFLDYMVMKIRTESHDNTNSIRKVELYIEYDNAYINWKAKNIPDDMYHPIFYLLDKCYVHNIVVNMHFPKVYYDSIIRNSEPCQIAFLEIAYDRYVYNVCLSPLLNRGLYNLPDQIKKRYATIINYHNKNSEKYYKYLYIINGKSTIVNDYDGDIYEIYQY